MQIMKRLCRDISRRKRWTLSILAFVVLATAPVWIAHFTELPEQEDRPNIMPVIGLGPFLLGQSMPEGNAVEVINLDGMDERTRDGYRLYTGHLPEALWYRYQADNDMLYEMVVHKGKVGVIKRTYRPKDANEGLSRLAEWRSRYPEGRQYNFPKGESVRFSYNTLDFGYQRFKTLRGYYEQCVESLDQHIKDDRFPIEYKTFSFWLQSDGHVTETVSDKDLVPLWNEEYSDMMRTNSIEARYVCRSELENDSWIHQALLDSPLHLKMLIMFSDFPDNLFSN